MAANTSATRFFGYENSCLTGNNIRSLIAGVTDRLLGEIQGVITEGRYMRIQAFAVHRDGKTFTVVEVIVMGNRVRAPNQVCYLVRDVQSRWQAEQTLLSVFHAMDNTDAGIGIVTLDGTVTYANRTMTSLLAGGEESAVIGQKLNVWFDRKSVVDPMLANIGRRQSWSGEQRMIRDAKTTWLMVSAVPDINVGSGAVRMVLSLRGNGRAAPRGDRRVPGGAESDHDGKFGRGVPRVGAASNGFCEEYRILSFKGIRMSKLSRIGK